MINHYKSWLSNTLINHKLTLAPSAFLKKTLYVFALFFLTATSWGQLSSYSFTSSSGTYTAITGGTVSSSGSNLDDGIVSVTLPTSFVFNGTTVTAIGFSSNGYLILGNTSSHAYTPISSTTTSTGVISPFGVDLVANAATAETRWEQIGNEIIFQWKHFRRYLATPEQISFQVRLNTSNGQIIFVYDGSTTVANSTDRIPQVGLRGATNADYNARRLTTSVPTSTPSWSNTAAASSNAHNVRFTSGSNAAFPSTGLTYTWTPPTPCSGSPTAGTISTANQYLCSGATVPNLVNTGFSSGVTGITFQWQQSTDDSNWINVTTGTGATTATYTPPVFAGTTIYYRCNVTCANGGGTAATASISINPPANPATQVTNAVASSISYSGFTTTWVNGNGNRRVVYVSDTAIVDPSNSTGAAAPTVNTVYAGSGQQIVYDDTGTTVTVTGLALGTTYYVKVIEYTRCGTTTFDNYYNTTAGTNAISVTTSSISPTPWSEGFATGVATFPNWQTTSGAAVGTATGLAALSSNYWYVNLYSSLTTAAVTTPIIGSIPSNYRFVVKYNLANYDSPYAPPVSSSGNFIVAISTDNGATYTNVETIANNAVAGWQEYVLNLSAYAGQNIRIRLTGNRTSGDYNLAFDDFKIEQIPVPTISTVTSSVACGTTTSTITITGTGLSSATSVKIGGATISPLASNTDTQITVVVTSPISGTVEVTTNGGSVTSSGTVSFAISPALTLNTATQNNCAGVTNSTLTTLTSTAADYDTYTWSPSTNVFGDATNGWTFNPTATTTYTLTATNSAGCSRTATKAVTVNPVPTTVTVSPGTTVIEPNSITTLTASGGTIASNQNVSNYAFSASTGTYNSITGTTVSPSTTDDNGVGNLPIGFTFPYNGGTQTVFGISTNGLLLLGNTSTSITGFSSNGIATNANVIAPLWDDNNIVGGSMSYLTTGTSPNRVLTVQWTNLHIGGGGSATNPTISMQAKLFENGDIQFVYGSTSATLSSPTASIGISGASGNYLSVSPAATISNSTASSSAENTSVNTSPLITGTTLNFTRPIIIGTSIAWSPTTDLYTDAGATVAYTGGAATTVYAKPTATTTYSATSTSTTGCTSIGSTTLKIGNTWTGTTSNAWSTASNWSASAVPTATDDVLISSNGSNAPVMDVDVTIPAGKSLTITGGTLTIAPGKVLTIAGTANFGGMPVTFKSDATGTAMLGTLTGTLTGATNVKVERYIPLGKRAFRLLSPAVTTTTFISGNWQEQTHITGGLGTTGLGFDATETNNPSMYTYDNQAAQGVSGWTPIPNTNNTNLIAGVGYRVLIRGDKTPANITSASANEMNAAITLSATGTLKTGTVPLSLSSTPSINNTTNSVTNGFSLVGNPYQSAVDWHLVTRTGIEDTYYAWDPNMGTGAARGNYVPYNVLTGNTFGGQVGQFIQPGQAFFVKNTGPGAGSLTFEEVHKATTSANVFRTANTPSLGVALYDPNELAIGGYPIDATKAVFSSEYTNELGLGDATKLEAAGENIAWFRNNTKLAIDAAAPVTTSDELVMKTLRLGANKNYTFKIQTTNFDTALTPYLVDTFLNTQTEIATSQAFLASFATTSNQASYSEDRFKIVFQTSALSADDFVKNIKLYPNPAKAGGSFYIDGITEATVSVYNVVGQNIPVTVMSQGNAVQVTPTAALSQGVYLVTVTTAGKTTQVKWIVE